MAGPGNTEGVVSSQGTYGNRVREFFRNNNPFTRQKRQESSQQSDSALEVLQIPPNSELSNFLQKLGPENSDERRGIEYPLKTIYRDRDFQKTISKLGVDQELENRIVTAFNDANFGVILRVIHLISLACRNKEKLFLIKQLESNLEQQVVKEPKTSPEYHNQRYWIIQGAGWNDLIAGRFKNPQFLGQSKDTIKAPSSVFGDNDLVPLQTANKSEVSSRN